MPPEDGVITYLHRQGFNSNAILPAAKAFLRTMIFLKELEVSESHGSKSLDGGESHTSDSGPAAETYGGARVGDFIQWEAQGVLQFAEPRRVRFVTDDDKWVAVDDSETGIPMNEVIVQDRPASGQDAPPPKFPLGSKSTIEPSQEGEVEWMRNRVGAESTVRILVKGSLGPKEIKRLLRLLEAQRDVLLDDDDEQNLQEKGLDR